MRGQLASGPTTRAARRPAARAILAAFLLFLHGVAAQPDSPSTWTNETFHDAIVSLYRRYNVTEKLHIVPSLVERFHGVEHQLIERIHNRYGTQKPQQPDDESCDADEPVDPVDTRPEAYATLVTSDFYAQGAMILGTSIQRWELRARQRDPSRPRRRLVAIMPSHLVAAEQSALSLRVTGYDDIVSVPEWVCPRPSAALLTANHSVAAVPAENAAAYSDDEWRFESTCAKLYLFNLTQYKTILYLDADTLLMTEAATTLFDRAPSLTPQRPLAAASAINPPTQFNAGVLLVRPTRSIFKALQAAVRNGSLSSGVTYDGGDQGILNAMFSDWWAWDAPHRLSNLFNCPQDLTAHKNKAGFRLYEEEGNGTVAIMHFLGDVKPWQSDRQLHTEPLRPYHKMYFLTNLATRELLVMKMAAGRQTGRMPPPPTAAEIAQALAAARLEVAAARREEGAEDDGVRDLE